jgi:MFS family permease
MSAPHPTAASGQAVKATRVRYQVLFLTFMTAFIMYIDRTCMGAAAPYIRKEFGIDIITMGWIASAFNLGYTLFQIPGGWMADRYGARKVLATAMALWSVFTVATGLAFNAVSLALTRFFFGLSEAAAFPAASRALVRWLPVKERAFGQGFQHAGSRFGAAVTPTIFVYLTHQFSWHWAFYAFGIVGIVWAMIWYTFYRNYPHEHPAVNRAEMEILAKSGPGLKAGTRVTVPWRQILRSRNVWLLSTMYFCYGWVFWIYMLWLPTYLSEVRGLTSIKMGLAASTPLLAATVTNALGGWLSDKLAHRLNDLRRGRLLVSVFGFSIAGITLIPAALAESMVTWLFCLTFALAALELTVAVSWAICLDIGGDFSGSVSGVMNTLGNLGGTVSSVSIGYLATHLTWIWVFLAASFMCIAAALLATRIDPSQVLTEE